MFKKNSSFNTMSFFILLILDSNLLLKNMKKITLFVALLLAFASQGYAQFPAPYCGPIIFGNNEEPITLVNFAGINNTSPAAVGGVAHEDFTSISGAVTAGDTYPITLKGNTDGNFTTWLRVFADWNQDSDFTDSGESYDVGSIVNSTGVDAVELTGSIYVPPTALGGNTRLRIVKKYNVYADSCNTGDGGYGEAEDYTLAVTAAACTPPTVAYSVVSLCPTQSFNVSVDISAMGTATSLSVEDDQGNAAQTATATGTLTFGPYTNGTSVVITVTHNIDTVCNLTSDALTQAGCVPGCASNPTPADGAVDVPYGPITLSWDAPTTGDPVVSYDLYAGNTATELEYVASYDDTTTLDDLTITAYGTTVYWQIVPVNEGGGAVGCDVWSFTTEDSPGYCLDATYGQYPSDTFVPETCDGVTENEIVSNAYAGEYSVVEVTDGESYTFISSVATDFITISTDDGATAEVFGTTPLSWTATLSGPIRFYTHLDDQCGYENVNRVRAVICGTPSTDAPDYANLQWPSSATVEEGSSFTVYGQVYEPGVTEPAGQGAGILAWVGVSTSNTNPDTWSTWTEMEYNPDATSTGNNDEYMGSLGAGLEPGTYYYATRYRLNEGGYVYGGIDATNNGNFWDGTTYLSGVLTVNAASVPANDLCAGAFALTVGGVFEDYPVEGTVAGATTTTGLTFACQTTRDNDVWYTAVVPASGTLTVATEAAAGSAMNDTVLSVFTGTCGTLTEVGCDDDSGTDTFSNVELTGLTPGETIYIGVWRWANDVNPVGAFRLSAFDASLSSGDFGRAGFKYSPNPVTSVLNLSHTDEIKSAAVYNLLGQQLLERTINASEAQLDLSALPKGTYLVKLTAANGMKTVKVVKE